MALGHSYSDGQRQIPLVQDHHQNAQGTGDTSSLHRAALLRSFSVRALVRLFQVARHQPEDDLDGQRVSKHSILTLNTIIFCLLLTSILYSRNFDQVAKLVLERAQEIPMHHRILYWHHCLR